MFVGPEIFAKTLGVIGLGAIGRMVANACIELGMSVIGYDPYLSDEAAKALNSNVKITADLNEVFTFCQEECCLRLHPLLQQQVKMKELDSRAF